MLLSLEWIKEYIDLEGYSHSQLSDILINLGIEVEGVKVFEPLDSQIVVAKILSVKKHPTATTLNICEVDVGKSQGLSIVCGASNVKKDLYVVVSLCGAKLPDGLVIEETTIRGEKSCGMICSEKELQISDEHDEIIELPIRYKVGAPLSDYINCSDTVFDLSLTPNRGDCLSYLGIARDLAAKLKKKVVIPNVDLSLVKKAETKVLVSSEVASKCERFVTLPVVGLSFQKSDLWLKRRLWVSGVRSNGLLVDVTNYVMLESGQPIHVYDLDNLEGSQLCVKKAFPGEKLTVIDQQTIECSEGDLLIYDQKKPVALAGVMGGEHSSVTEKTKNVAIEVAHFDPTAIRKTSRRLALLSESSHRFERGIDVENILNVAKRVCSLIYSLSNRKEGVLLGKEQDSCFIKVDPVKIPFDYREAQKILGLSSLDKKTCIDHLKSLGCQVSVSSNKEEVFVTPASWRNDLVLDIDLIEEVGRLEGFDKIEYQNPTIRGKNHLEASFYEFSENSRSFFSSCDLTEIITYPFVSQKDYEDIFVSKDHLLFPSICLKNPLSEASKWLRTSLVPHILQSISKNRNRLQTQIKLFEVGRGYFDIKKDQNKNLNSLVWSHIFRKEKHFSKDNRNKNCPVERTFLCGALDSPLNEDSWQKKKKESASFFAGKELLSRFFAAFNIQNVAWEKALQTDFPFLHPSASAALFIEKTCIGFLGELHPEVSLHYDLGIENIPLVFELDLESLCDHSLTPKFSGHKIYKYPSSYRDLSLEIKNDLSYDELSSCIYKCPEMVNLSSFRLFDLYKGEGIRENHKSVAVRFVFQSNEKTLTDKEVDKNIRVLLKWMSEKVAARQR